MHAFHIYNNGKKRNTTEIITIIAIYSAAHAQAQAPYTTANPNAIAPKESAKQIA